MSRDEVGAGRRADRRARTGGSVLNRVHTDPVEPVGKRPRPGRPMDPRFAARWPSCPQHPTLFLKSFFPSRCHRARGPPGRRGRPGAGLAQAELRQGAVPRPLPARPDPPAPDARRRGRAARRGVPRQTARLLRNRDRLGPHRARGPDPRRGRGRAQGARRLRHEDRHEVRRPRPHPGVLQQGARSRRLREPRDRRPALRASVDRRTAAAEALRHPGAEREVPAALRPHRHLRLPADRARRGLRPGPARHHGRPGRGRRTSSTG